MLASIFYCQTFSEPTVISHGCPYGIRQTSFFFVGRLRWPKSLQLFHIKIKVQDQIIFLLVINTNLFTDVLFRPPLQTWDKICNLLKPQHVMSGSLKRFAHLLHLLEMQPLSPYSTWLCGNLPRVIEANLQRNIS